jgi:hypothetical protein
VLQRIVSVSLRKLEHLHRPERSLNRPLAAAARLYAQALAANSAAGNSSIDRGPPRLSAYTRRTTSPTGIA